MTAGVGVVLMLAWWAFALRGLAWSWQKHVPVLMSAGESVRGDFRELRQSQVFWMNVRRHTVGWTIFFSLFFLALGLAKFPVWQRLVIAAGLAAWYASARIAQGEGSGGAEAWLFGPKRDRAWYWVLAAAEWFGYLGVLVFCGQAVVEVVAG